MSAIQEVFYSGEGDIPREKPPLRPLRITGKTATLTHRADLKAGLPTAKHRSLHAVYSGL